MEPSELAHARVLACVFSLLLLCASSLQLLIPTHQFTPLPPPALQLTMEPSELAHFPTPFVGALPLPLTRSAAHPLTPRPTPFPPLQLTMEPSELAHFPDADDPDTELLCLPTKPDPDVEEDVTIGCAICLAFPRDAAPAVSSSHLLWLLLT